MKNRRPWPIYLLLITFVVLGARLTWHLSSSETGWKPHLKLWVGVADSVAGIDRQDLSHQDPPDQAAFWLNEVQRIGAVHTDPEVALGAAWMLDAPQFGFISRHVRLTEGLHSNFLPASWRRELDRDAIAALSEQFETLCRSECIASIDRAVQLDPSNIELRRARALLLFPFHFMSIDSKPRQDDWLTVLDECAQADPENALYDYLAALHLWKSSADNSWERDGYVLNIENQDRFDEGNARLSAGLGKPLLSFGTQGYAATFKFLEHSSVSRSDHIDVVVSRQIDNRSAILLYGILRWEFVKSDLLKRAGRLDEATDAAGRVLAIAQQVTKADNGIHVAAQVLVLREWSLATLASIHRNHPDVFDADEAVQASKQLAEAQRESKVMEEAARRLAAKTGRTGTSLSEVSLSESAKVQSAVLYAFLFGSALMLVVVCGALALIFWPISVLAGKSRDGDQVKLGWIRQIVAWLIAGGITFVLWGMFPAEIVPVTAQTWLVCGAIWAGIVAVVATLLSMVRRRFELTVGQTAALATVIAIPMIAIVFLQTIVDLAVAIVAGLHPVLLIAMVVVLTLLCWATIRSLRMFINNQNLPLRRKFLAMGIVILILLVAVPAGIATGMAIHDRGGEAWILPTVWKETRSLQFDAAELRSAIKMDDSRWAWAFIQWQAYSGPLVAPIIAVVIVMVWHLLRRSIKDKNGLRSVLRSQKRTVLGESARSVVASCLLAVLVFLNLYLAAAPRVSEIMDDRYRTFYTRMTRPALVWTEIEELIVDIQSEDETMARFQAEIDERNRGLAEAEAWEKEKENE